MTVFLGAPSVGNICNIEPVFLYMQGFYSMREYPQTEACVNIICRYIFYKMCARVLCTKIRKHEHIVISHVNVFVLTQGLHRQHLQHRRSVDCAPRAPRVRRRPAVSRFGVLLRSRVSLFIRPPSPLKLMWKSVRNGEGEGGGI